MRRAKTVPIRHDRNAVSIGRPYPRSETIERPLRRSASRSCSLIALIDSRHSGQGRCASVNPDALRGLSMTYDSPITIGVLTYMLLGRFPSTLAVTRADGKQHGLQNPQGPHD